MFFSIHRLLFFLALTLWPLGGKENSSPSEIKKSQLEIPQGIEKDLKVRVSLVQSGSEVSLSTDNPFHVWDGQGRLLFKGTQIQKTTVAVSQDGVRMGKQIFKSLPLVVNGGDAVLRIDNRSYRNSLEFSQTPSGKLLIVNELDLEDYLRGVLPWEANPKWTQESLKAQAVASRTYALFKIIENSDQPFAVSNDVISQVYGGATLEKESTNRAVAATRGQVLVYRGKIFPTFFHSTCGGRTTRAENAWPIQPHAVLRGGSCGFCTESPHYRWRGVFSEQELKNALKKLGYTVAKIERLKTADEDESGRARFFVIEHPSGKFKIQAADFRLALSPMKFKSLRIQRIWRKDGDFVFSGQGWGHGVGLCQYGAKKMGELGYTYKQILEYYYPGSEMITLE